MNNKYAKKIKTNVFLVFNFFLFISSIFFSSKITAQTKGIIEVVGKCVTEKGPLAGATVSAFKNGSTKVAEQVSDGRGKFTFDIPLGENYIINFSGPGYINMFLQINAKDIQFDDKTVYEPIVQFYSKAEGGEDMIEKFKDPFAKVIWNMKKRKFIDDEEYNTKFISNVMAQERMDRLAEEKEKARRAQMRKEREEHDKSILAQAKAAKDAKEQVAKEAELARKQQEERLLAENLKRDKELAEQLEREHDALAKKLEDSMKAYEVKMKREAKALTESKNKEGKIKENETAQVDSAKRIVVEAEIIPIEVTKAVIKQFDRDLARKVEQNEIDKLEKEKANEAIVETERRVKAEKSLYNLYYALAYANRTELIGSKYFLPEYKSFIINEIPKVSVNESEGYFTYIRTTFISHKKQTYTYRKERTIWGSVHCYKNDREIGETAYNNEIQYYLPYVNKKK